VEDGYGTSPSGDVQQPETTKNLFCEVFAFAYVPVNLGNAVPHRTLRRLPSVLRLKPAQHISDQFRRCFRKTVRLIRATNDLQRETVPVILLRSSTTVWCWRHVGRCGGGRWLR